MSERLRRAAPVAAALAGAVAAVVYLALRPGWREGVPHLELLEWAGGGLLLVAVAAWMKGAVRRSGAEEPWRSRARRHSPEPRPRLDPAYEAWSRATRAFLDRGERRREYEALWTAAFETVARRPATVAKALEPLTGLAEAPAPKVFRFPWALRKLDEENRRRRLQAHRTLLARWRAARKVQHGQVRRRPHP